MSAIFPGSYRGLENIGELILNTPGIVNYNRNSFFEVKPGVFSPIYINLKSALNFPHVRKAVVENIARVIDETHDYLCGIESGGSYYAFGAADVLAKPAILLRKSAKLYGEGGRIVGNRPPRASSVALIDDTLAQGRMLTEAVAWLRQMDCEVKYYCIFSYGLDQYLEKFLNVKITSLVQFQDICTVGKNKGIFNQSDVDFLGKYVDNLSRSLGSGHYE